MSDIRHFADDLNELKRRLLFMGARAEERVRAALDALVAADLERIQEVIASDDELNTLQIELDDRCFKLLALQQPVAGDLRFIVSASKITVDLERVGDLAVNIAEASERYVMHPPVKTLIDLPRMGLIARGMLATALEAFLAQSVTLAESVLVEDDRLDQLTDQVFRELLTYMLGDSRTIEPSLDLLLISRHLERIGDHATNIAEDVIFIVEARDVRHHAFSTRKS